jgi:glycosyltransferase involved in cell wall biosynthesis
MIDIALPRFVSPRRKFFLFISKIVFSSVRRVICFASKQANFWNFILGLKDRAIFVPFGTDEKSSHLNNLNNLTLSNYIFSAGAAARDYKTLIKAIEGVNINLLIVAGRDPMTGKIALPSTLPPNVRLKVEIPKEEYKRLLAKSRFVIVPLKDVPFVCGQSVILDAMSMGKAVIATRGVSTIDYIVDGETGLLVEAGDVESLKAKILFLLENPLKAKEIGENAKRAVQIYFNQRLMQKKIGMIVENAYISTNINCKSSKCDKFRHC